MLREDNAFDLSDSSDDDVLAATQVASSSSAAATVVVAVAAAAAAAAGAGATTLDARVRCAVCALDVSTWTIERRAVHMNACLDAAADAAAASDDCLCPTCGKQLADYNAQRRSAHANLCLDRLLAADASNSSVRATSTSTSAPPQQSVSADSSNDTYSCVICGCDLTRKDLTARIRHVKQCGQRFGVRPSDVAALQPGDEGRLAETAVEMEASASEAADQLIGEDAVAAIVDLSGEPSAATNAFAVMMRASSVSTTVLSDTIGRVGHVVSNAFEVLMKSSKTQAVVAAASSSGVGGNGGSSFRLSAQPRAGHVGKKRRTGSASSWSRSADADPTRCRPCPDFKRIKGTQPSFIVDGFQYASKALSSVYFLTHFHSDHYTGLDKRFDCGVIYCNAVTAALVVQELRIDSKWVHPVPMNTPVMIHETQVTFMDANHCPGAAIILFRLKNGQAFLHTGDFRYHPKMLSYAPLQRYVPPAPGLSSSLSDGGASAVLSRLDGIYLDTTYADPKYVFPTQQTAIDHTLELMAKHTLSDKTLFLFGSYSIGKERLFMEVAAKYQRKVCVSKAKLKFIATFGWANAEMQLLTTEPGATNLHVVPMQDLKMEHLTALLDKHRLRFREIVAFRPTGWTFSRASQSLSTCRTDATGRIRIYGVPYSEHSSFAELVEFVRVMDPHLIIPTVNCYNEKSAKKQVDALRQVAFKSITNLFAAGPQQ